MRSHISVPSFSWLSPEITSLFGYSIKKGRRIIAGRSVIAQSRSRPRHAGLSHPARNSRRGLASVRPLPHRMELVAEGKGVRWVNDSKATNVAAARTAITGLVGPAIVLLGGNDKGEDFSSLATALAETDARALVFGEAGPRLFEALRDRASATHLSGDFEAIMAAAAAAAAPARFRVPVRSPTGRCQCAPVAWLTPTDCAARNGCRLQ